MHTENNTTKILQEIPMSPVCGTFSNDGDAQVNKDHWINDPYLGLAHTIRNILFDAFRQSPEVEQLFKIAGDDEEKSFKDFALSVYAHIDVECSGVSRGRRESIRVTLNQKRLFTEVQNRCSHNYRSRTKRHADLQWYRDLIEPNHGTLVVDICIDRATCKVIHVKRVGDSRRQKTQFFKQLIHNAENDICDELGQRFAAADD
jgi:hypothetical protein